eukprot:gene6837-4925_t
MSNDGVYIVVLSTAGRIYLSSTSGSHFRTISLSGTGWNSIAISADGQYILAGSYDTGSCSNSSDFGATWATSLKCTFAAQVGITDVTMNSDGTVQAVSTPQSVYVSFNTGNTFTKQYDASIMAYFGALTISGNGVMGFVADKNDLDTSTSINGLVIWASITALTDVSTQCTNVVMSYDGSVIAVTCWDVDYFVYNTRVSTDSGETWTPFPTQAPDKLAISATGTRILALHGNESFISMDSGQTFETYSISIGKTIDALACNASAMHCFAAVENNLLFYSLLGDVWSPFIAPTDPPTPIPSPAPSAAPTDLLELLTPTATDLVSPIDDFTEIASDEGFTFYVVSTGSGPFYVSSNAGTTWSTYEYPNNHVTSMSVTYDHASVFLGTNHGLCIVSTDFGSSFLATTKCTAASESSIVQLVVSKVGTYWGVLTEANDLFFSSDGGNTFTNKTSQISLLSNAAGYAMSGNGTFQVVVGGTHCYTSKDAGETWALTATTTFDFTHKVFMDYHGTLVATIVGTEGVYISRDFAKTWTLSYSNSALVGLEVALYDGAILAMDSTTVYLSSDYGETWTTKADLGQPGLVDVTCDIYCLTTAFAVENLGIYYSDDSGGTLTLPTVSPTAAPTFYSFLVTFTGYSEPDEQTSVLSMSTSGQTIVAAHPSVMGSIVYKSQDYGVTWSSVSTYLDITSIKVSDSGQYIWIGATNGVCWYSSSYGSSVYNSDACTVGSYSAIGQIAMSSSGQYVGLVTIDGAYFSSDYGTTFTAITSTVSSTSYAGYAISESGQYQVILGPDVLWISSNSGGSWTSRTFTGTNFLYGLYMAYSPYLLVTQYAGQVYVSKDIGVTWTITYDYGDADAHLLMDVTRMDNVVLVSNGSTTILSEDGGDTWETIGSGSFYVTSDAGVQWDYFSLSNGDFVTTDYVVSAALSDNGRYMVVLSNSKCAISTTYGANFTLSFMCTVGNEESNVQVAMDGSGRYIGVVTTTGAYISSDYGNSFSSLTSTLALGSYDSYVISQDGSYHLVVGGANGRLSTNNGSTWAAKTYSTPFGVPLQMSNNGARIVTAVDFSVYLSGDYGNSFNSLFTFSSPVEDVAISGDGSVIAVVDNDHLSVYSFSGPQWDFMLTLKTSSFSHIACDSSCSLLMVGVNNVGAFYSTDYGYTLQQSLTLSSYTDNLIETFTDLVSDYTGNHTIASSTDGYFYVHKSNFWYVGHVANDPIQSAGISLSGQVMVLGTQYGRCIISLDYGITWAITTRCTPYYMVQIQKVVVDTADTYIAILTDEGVAYVSENQGANFVDVSPFGSIVGYAISTASSTTHLAVAATTVAFTTDAGYVWTSYSQPTFTFLGDLVALNGSLLIAHVLKDSAYYIAKSVDYGSSWDLSFLHTYSTLTAFIMSSDASTIFVSNGTALYRSSGDSSTWTLVHSSATMSIDGVACAYNCSTAYVAVSGDGVYYSKDYGVTLINPYAPTETPTSMPSSAPSAISPDQDWVGVAMSDDGLTVVALSYSGIVYFSKNGGVSYRTRTLTSSYSWIGIAMSSNAEYLMAATSGDCALSSDYGMTWAVSTKCMNYQSLSITAVAISGDGKYQGVTTTVVMFGSSNYGSSFAQKFFQTLGNAYFTSLALSNDGQIAVIGDAQNGHTVVSRNFLTSWSSFPDIASACSHVAMNGNGTVFAMSCYNAVSEEFTLRVSNDSGLTFGEAAIEPSAIAVSNSGDRIVAIKFQTAYVSTDYGSLFSIYTTAMDASIAGLACNRNCTSMVAAVATRPLFYSLLGDAWYYLDTPTHSPTFAPTVAFDVIRYPSDTFHAMARSSDGTYLLLSGASQFYVSSSGGYNWSVVDKWSAVVFQAAKMSDSGRYMVLGSDSGSCAFSSNYGKSWDHAGDCTGGMELSIKQIGMDASGQYIGVLVYANRLFLSTDYGGTFAEPAGVTIGYAGGYAISSDGTFHFLLTNNSAWTSTNSGSSWSSIQYTAHGFLSRVSMSHNGSVIATNLDGYGFYVSYDLGNNWEFAYAAQFSDFEVARYGSYIVASNQSSLFVSEDSGGTWSVGNENTQYDTDLITGLACNRNCSNIAFARDTYGVYYSFDHGRTFRNQADTSAPTSFPSSMPTNVPTSHYVNPYVVFDPIADYRDIAMSRSGDLIVAVSGTKVYASADYGKSYRQLHVASSGYSYATVAVSSFGDAVLVGGVGCEISFNYGVTWRTFPEGCTQGETIVDVGFALNGKYVAVATLSEVRLSKDNGTTFTTANSGLTNIAAFAISHDGHTMVTCTFAALVSSNSSIVYANDGIDFYYETGPTQMPTSMPTSAPTIKQYVGPADQWLRLATSASTKYVVALAKEAKVYVSTDFGNTFELRNLASSSITSITEVRVSSSGQYVFIAGQSYCGLSNDYGSTFSEISCAVETRETFTAMQNAMDSTGQYLGIVLRPLESNPSPTLLYRVFYSTNYGASFSFVTGFTHSTDITGYVISSDGSSHVVSDGTNVLISSNTGADWSAVSVGGSIKLGRLVMSADGFYLGGNNIAGSGFYITANGGYSWVQRTTFSFVDYFVTGVGNVWYAITQHFVYRSTNNANSFTALPTYFDNLVVVTANSTGDRMMVGETNETFSFSTDYGVSYSVVSNPTQSPTTSPAQIFVTPLKSWLTIAMDWTGNYITACAANDHIYVSSDAGITYEQKPDTSAYWVDIVMSVNGQYQLAGASGVCGLSKNYGDTWTVSAACLRGDTTISVVQVAMDSIGQYMGVAGSFSTSTGNGVLISNDYGTTWSAVQAVSASAFSGIAISATGQHQFFSAGSFTMHSTNYGISWTFQSPGVGSFGKLTINGDGSVLASPVDSSYIYVSRNYGTSWTNTGRTAFQDLAIDYDGDYWVGTTGTYIYYSNDSAVTWYKGGQQTNYGSISGVACNRYCNVTVFSAYSNYIYYSYDGGISYTDMPPTSTPTSVPTSQPTQQRWIDDWTGVAVSSSGQYIALTSEASNGAIYMSSDYGNTFEAAPGTTGPWLSVEMSSTGQILLAYGGTGKDMCGISSDFGSTWTVGHACIKFSTGYQIVQASLSSSTGQYMAIASKDPSATGLTSSLFLSSNYGGSFSYATQTVSTSISGYALGSSGSFQIVVDGADVYQSTDTGQTWSSWLNGQSSPGYYQNLRVNSGDGGYYLVYGYSSVDNQFYRSEDSGDTWTAPFATEFTEYYLSTTVLLASDANYVYKWDSTGQAFSVANNDKVFANVSGIACNDTSCSLSLFVQNGGELSSSDQGFYISSDYGATFAAASLSSTSPSGYAISTDGLLHVAVDYDFKGTIYRSFDGGSNWETLTIAPGYWKNLVMSNTGQYMALASDSNTAILNRVYVSSDYGVTWTYTGYNFTTFTISGNGQHWLATANGYVYRSGDYGQSWTTATNQTFSSVNSIALNDQGNYSVVVIPDSQVLSATGTTTLTFSNQTFAVGSTSIDVTMTGLQALGDYTVYCAIRTIDGSSSTLSNVLSVAKTVTTACCKTMSFTSTYPFVYNQETLYSAGYLTAVSFTYALSTIPKNSVTVTPLLYATTTGQALSSSAYSISPASRTWTSSSSNLPSTFTVVVKNTSLTGSFALTLVPSGASASEYYNVSYSPFNVLAYSAATIPAPKLSRVIFGDSGLRLFVTFDTSTNEAGFGESNAWGCSLIFTLPSAPGVMCTWLNTTTVSFRFVSSTATVVAGDTFTLMANKVRANCAVLTNPSDCVFLQNNTAQSISITAALNPVAPSPVITVPSTVNPCGAFMIDPSQSSGSAGRTWTTIAWNVTSTSGSAAVAATTLTTLLNTPQSSSSSSSSTSLSAPTYLVSLTLTNYLGQTRTTTARFFYGGAVNTPSVTILGANTYTIYPKNTLTLTTNATLSSCIAGTSQLNFTWSFQLSSGQTVTSSISYTTRNPRILVVPAYQFVAGNSYLVRVTVVATRAGYTTTTASASVTVNVLSGAVVAQLTGGSAQSLTADTTLDASSSYDENAAASSVGASGLTYTWVCSTLSYDFYGDDCSYIFNSTSSLSSSNSSKMSIAYLAMNTSSLYGVTVVAKAADGRYGAATVELKALVRKINKGQALITSSSSTFNSDAYFTLSAEINSNTGVLGTWTATQGSRALSLSSIALTPTELNFTSALTANGVTYQLKLYAGSLTAGATTTFTLSVLSWNSVVSNRQLLSVASVDITVNGPPSAGMVEVEPSIGFAFNTTFYCQTSSWEDDSLPLTYDFRYQVPPVSQFLFLQSASASPSASGYLPAGNDGYDHRVVVVVRAYDVYSANASVSTNVTVTLMSTTTSTEVSSLLTEQLEKAVQISNNDLAVAIANSAATYFTATNCSGTPPAYCAARHRQPCSTTENTCGSCQDGYYGYIGDSNLFCTNSTTGNGDDEGVKDIGQLCTTDDDCLFGRCDTMSRQCVEPPQSCPSTDASLVCSGHGRCDYIASTNPNQRYASSDCGVFSTYCAPTCLCEDGYGGTNCATSPADLTAKLAVYDSICAAIVYVANTSDVSAQLLDSLASTLYLTSRGVQALGQSVSATCQDALTQVASSMADVDVSQATYASPQSLIDALSNFILPGESSFVDESLSYIVRGLLASLANGEDAVAYASDHLQVQIRRDLATAFEDAEVTFPSNTKEASYNTTQPRLQLVNQAGRYCANSDGFIQMTSTKWSTTPFAAPNATVSSMVRTEFYANPDVDAYPEVDMSTPMYYYTMPFTTQQSLLNYSMEDRLLNPGLNNTVPACYTYSDDDAASSYSSCGTCEVSTYTNDSVVFVCYDIQDLCGNPRYEPPTNVTATIRRRQLGQQPLTVMSSAIDEETLRERREARAQRRWLLSLSGDDDGGQLSAPNARVSQVTALLVDAGDALALILQQNPFAIDWASAKAIVSFVGLLVVLWLLGALVFAQWDVFDYYLATYGTGSGADDLAMSHRGQLKKQKTMGAALSTVYRKVMDQANVAATKVLVRVASTTSHLLHTSESDTDLMGLQGYAQADPRLQRHPLVRRTGAAYEVGTNGDDDASAATTAAAAAAAAAKQVDEDERQILWFQKAVQRVRSTGLRDIKGLLNRALPMTARVWRYHGLTGVLQALARRHVLSSINLTFTLLVATLSLVLALPVDIFLDYLRLEYCQKRPDWSKYAWVWNGDWWLATPSQTRGRSTAAMKARALMIDAEDEEEDDEEYEYEEALAAAGGVGAGSGGAKMAAAYASADTVSVDSGRSLTRAQGVIHRHPHGAVVAVQHTFMDRLDRLNHHQPSSRVRPRATTTASHLAPPRHEEERKEEPLRSNNADDAAADKDEDEDGEEERKEEQRETSAVKLSETKRHELLLAYAQHIHGSEEVLLLLNKLKQYVDRFLHEKLMVHATGFHTYQRTVARQSSARLSSSVSTRFFEAHGHEHSLFEALELRAMERALGLRVDGSATPLSLAERLRYGDNYAHKLHALLMRARRQMQLIVDTVDSIPLVTLSVQDAFAIEQSKRVASQRAALAERLLRHYPMHYGALTGTLAGAGASPARSISPEKSTISKAQLFRTQSFQIYLVRQQQALRAQLQFYRSEESRNVAMIRYFAIEQFSSFKRYVLETQYFPIESALPAPTDPLLWCLAWVLTVGFFLFCCFWVLLWGATSGKASFASWGLNFVLVFIQEIVFAEVVKLVILQLVAMYAIEPQLLSIYRVLYRKAVDFLEADLARTAQEATATATATASMAATASPSTSKPPPPPQLPFKDPTVPAYRPLYLIQHVSPVCRAAHSAALYDLPTSRLLRSITGADLEICKLMDHKPLHWLVLYFVAIPVIVGFLGRDIATAILTATLPTSLYMFILVNYYLIQISALTMLALYLGVGLFYWYRHRVARPAFKQLNRELQSTASRGQHHRMYEKYAKRQTWKRAQRELLLSTMGDRVTTETLLVLGKQQRRRGVIVSPNATAPTAVMSSSRWSSRSRDEYDAARRSRSLVDGDDSQQPLPSDSRSEEDASENGSGSQTSDSPGRLPASSSLPWSVQVLQWIRASWVVRGGVAVVTAMTRGLWWLSKRFELLLRELPLRVYVRVRQQALQEKLRSSMWNAANLPTVLQGYDESQNDDDGGGDEGDVDGETPVSPVLMDESAAAYHAATAAAGVPPPPPPPAVRMAPTRYQSQLVHNTLTLTKSDQYDSTALGRKLPKHVEDIRHSLWQQRTEQTPGFYHRRRRFHRRSPHGQQGSSSAAPTTSSALPTGRLAAVAAPPATTTTAPPATPAAGSAAVEEDPMAAAASSSSPTAAVTREASLPRPLSVRRRWARSLGLLRGFHVLAVPSSSTASATAHGGGRRPPAPAGGSDTSLRTEEEARVVDADRLGDYSTISTVQRMSQDVYDVRPPSANGGGGGGGSGGGGRLSPVLSAHRLTPAANDDAPPMLMMMTFDQLPTSTSSTGSRQASSSVESPGVTAAASSAASSSLTSQSSDDVRDRQSTIASHDDATASTASSSTTTSSSLRRQQQQRASLVRMQTSGFVVSDDGQDEDVVVDGGGRGSFPPPKQPPPPSHGFDGDDDDVAPSPTHILHSSSPSSSSSSSPPQRPRVPRAWRFALLHQRTHSLPEESLGLVEAVLALYLPPSVDDGNGGGSGSGGDEGLSRECIAEIVQQYRRDQLRADRGGVSSSSFSTTAAPGAHRGTVGDDSDAPRWTINTVYVALPPVDPATATASASATATSAAVEDTILLERVEHWLLAHATHLVAQQRRQWQRRHGSS